MEEILPPLRKIRTHFTTLFSAASELMTARYITLYYMSTWIMTCNIVADIHLQVKAKKDKKSAVTLFSNRGSKVS